MMKDNSTQNNSVACPFQLVFISTGNRSHWAVITFCIVATLSIILNLLLMYGFYRTSRPFSKVTLLFVFMSSLDYMSCVVSLVEYSFSRFNVQISCWLFGILSCVSLIIYTSQLLTLCLISYLRFQSIRTPLTTVQINPSKKPLILFLVLGFLTIFLIGAIFFTMGQLEIFTHDIMLMVLFVTDCINLVVVILIVILNITSYVILRSMGNNPSINPTDSASSSVAVSNRSMANEREALKTLAIITVFYVVCCFPLILGYILYPLDVITGEVDLMADINFNLYYANTGINSLIYILRNKKLLNFFKGNGN